MSDQPMHPATRADRTQQGYSLIEVMVAIAISLFLLGGTLTILQHTRSTYTAQTQLVQLQDDERMAMSLLTDVIQSAGYYPNPHMFTDLQTLVSPSLPADGAPNIWEGAVSGVTGAVGDTITVRYAAAPTDNVFDCRGDPYAGTAAFETWENTFWVAKVATSQYQLLCTRWSKSSGAFVTTPLVRGAPPVGGIPTGIQRLDILYGVNTTGGTGGTCTDTYKSSAKMAATDWSSVCSVKVTLTFANPFNPKGGLKPTITLTRVIAVMNTA